VTAKSEPGEFVMQIENLNFLHCQLGDLANVYSVATTTMFVYARCKLVHFPGNFSRLLEHVKLSFK
jgi:hypothetical protein